ncbi:MAG: DNA adenine methylase [Planctomycetes bacterium]|nr:DNA adenine methylase [Planctomycetota bacterium]
MAKSKVVNVAAVKKLSPFRYPGGKTWLVPYAKAWLASLPHKPTNFIEPFAGGGIISLTVGFDGLADRVTMIELDDDVASVWQTIFGANAKWLWRRIEEFEISVENVKKELESRSTSIRQKAFQTILKNRTYHGGILAAGSGLIKSGEAGKGISSRWYANTLSKRIQGIYELRSKFDFIQGDGISLLNSYAKEENIVAFIDPPYTAGKNGKRAGKRLYNHNQLDHEALFDVASKLKGDFLMTYDNDTEVRDLARKFGFVTDLIPMKNTHHAEMTELVIGRNLDWLSDMRKAKPVNQWLFDPNAD